VGCAVVLVGACNRPAQEAASSSTGETVVSPAAPSAAPPAPSKPEADPEACPRRFAKASLPEGEERSCTCPDRSSLGTIWGTLIYTGDSMVCKAAVHAGAIPDAGGRVTVKRAPGCDKYSGSKQNGVKSSDYHRYSFSIFFPGHGDGTCD